MWDYNTASSLGEQFIYSITTLVIEEGVTSIGAYAFFGCRNLSGVLIIPESVTSIGSNAFNNCVSIGNISSLKNVKTIGSSAFLGCGGILGGLDLSGVTSIGDNAFQNCEGISDVKFSDSLESIGRYAFSGCHYIRRVYYTGSEGQWNGISLGVGNAPIYYADKIYNCNSAIPSVSGTVVISVKSASPVTSAVLMLSSPSNEYTIGLKGDGSFDVTDLPEDVYTVTLKKLGHLSHTVTGVTLSGGSIDLGEIELIPGDVSGDGFIDAVDVSALVAVLLTAPEGEEPSDFNGDNYIDAVDVSLLANNMFKTPTSSQFGE